MKKLSALLFLMFLKVLIYAQIPSFSWVQTLPPNFTVQSYQSDTSGNIVLVGNVSGVVDFDLGPGVSNWTTPNNPPCCPTEDGFIAKYNSGGQLLWKVLFSSINHEVLVGLTLDDAGDIYIKGSNIDTTIDLDPGAGTYFLNSTGSFIAKYSSSGSLVWVDEIGIYSAKMSIDPLTNDLLVAGTYYDTIDIDPSAAVLQLAGIDPNNPTFYMARFNSSTGQLIWADNFFNSSTAGNVLSTAHVKSDNLGNIFLAGDVSGTIDMDPSAGVNTITNSNYIAKYNSLGQLLLLQVFPAEIYSFDIDSNNNIALGGTFVSLVDFNLGAGTNYLDAGPASNDFFLAKYDNNLNYIWAFTHGTTPNTFSQIESVHFDSNDDMLVSGNYDLPFSASDFDPGAGIYMVPIGTSNFIAKYSAASDLLAFAKVNGLLGNFSATTYLNKTNNKLLLFGSYVGTIDFDLNTGVFNKTFALNEKFLARYDLVCTSNPVYANDTICYGDTLYFGSYALYSTGNYPLLLTSASGCDSTLVMNLYVRPQVLTNLNITLCSAQYYYFNGMNINTPGIYNDTLISYTGCDSLVNLTLSVVPVNYSINQSGYILTSLEPSAAYQWYNCTTDSIIVGATGISFSVNSTADYGVIISKSGCVDTTTCMNIIGPGTAGSPPANLWGNQYGPMTAQFYKVDKNGNSYVVGNTLPAVDLDPDTSVFMPPYDIYGMYILKYSPSGSFLWAKWIETNQWSNYIMDVDVDSTGAIYFSGIFQTAVDMDAGAGVTLISPVALSNIFLCKYDASGNFQWVHSFGTSGDNNPFSIAIDKTNNVYMTGYFEDDIDFDPGAGTSIISTLGGTVFNFIVKYGPAGNYISGTGIDSWVQIEKITVDGANNIIYAGSFWDSADLNPGAGSFIVNDLSPGSQQNSFIAKVDQSYNFISGMSMSSDMLLQISDITTDQANNILATGYYRSSLNDFDAGAGTPSLPYAGNDDVFIVSYSPFGNFQWVRQVANMNSDFSTTIVANQNSDAYVMGKYSNTIDADGTTGMLLLNCSGASDNYVTTYDDAGNFNWAFRVGSPQDDDPVGMGLDMFGNLYLSGNSLDSVPFMSAEDSYARLVMSGVYIAKYGQCNLITNTVTDNGAYFSSDDSGGNYQWYNCSTGTAISGAINQSFYPSAAGQYSVMVGTGDCATMSSCLTFIGVTLTEENFMKDQLLIFPNPANDKITVSSTYKIKFISIIDISGRILLLLRPEYSDKLIEINTTQLKSGIYLMDIQINNGELRREKIVISR